jgi:hypothetical protein
MPRYNGKRMIYEGIDPIIFDSNPIPDYKSALKSINRGVSTYTNVWIQ